MTCIIAYTIDGQTWMGADSYSETSGIKHLSSNKVRKVSDGQGGTILMGSSGNARLRDVIDLALSRILLASPNVPKFITKELPELIREAAAEIKYCVTEDSAEMLPGDTLLVAWQGNIFQLDSHYHMAKIEEGYYAIGSGARFAMGALYTLYTHVDKGFTIKEEIGIALGAAALFDSYVCEPFDIVKG